MTTSSPFLCSKWLLHASQRVEDLQDLSVPIWGGQSGKLYTVFTTQTFRFQSVWKNNTLKSVWCHHLFGKHKRQGNRLLHRVLVSELQTAAHVVLTIRRIPCMGLSYFRCYIQVMTTPMNWNPPLATSERSILLWRRPDKTVKTCRCCEVYLHMLKNSYMSASACDTWNKCWLRVILHHIL